MIGDGYYTGHAICPKCGTRYKLSKLMEKFTYWFCHRDQDGYPCKTLNVRKDDDVQFAIPVSPAPPQEGGSYASVEAGEEGLL